ncbi:hypothetical protein V6Z11_1Z047300 [Gossypium hirsutum]
MGSGALVLKKNLMRYKIGGCNTRTSRSYTMRYKKIEKNLMRYKIGGVQHEDFPGEKNLMRYKIGGCNTRTSQEKKNLMRYKIDGCNTRTSQEVTHPSTTLAQARLTAEF